MAWLVLLGAFVDVVSIDVLFGTVADVPVVTVAELTLEWLNVQMMRTLPSQSSATHCGFTGLKDFFPAARLYLIPYGGIDHVGKSITSFAHFSFSSRLSTI